MDESSNRNYILERLKSRTMSIDEFNYDKLQVPPIASMFTPFDIAELNRIVRSLKYSAKPEIRYKEIDKIMRSRGFVKFISGTNRVAYRPLENNSFLVKVAADAVGLGDNPAEFKNQFIFKPFVTKVFEVTPCGTLGVFERVNPITSREEFLSVSKDIYSVINDWFVGEYVMADIGTRFFMNWGIRKSFGPVLLDFPYAYKLDGDKLFCNAPDINTVSGKCDGTIDYDPGFNFLYCTKCGVKYKAQELAQAIKSNNIITRSEGEIKMKISIKGGSKNVKKNLETGEFADLKKSIPTNKMVVSTDKKKPVEKKEEKKPVEKKEEKKPVEKKETKNKKEAICPIEFDESLKDKKYDTKPAKKITPLEKFKIAIAEAAKAVDEIEDAEDLIKALTDENFISILKDNCVSITVPDVNSVAYNPEFETIGLECRTCIYIDNDDDTVVWTDEHPVEIHIPLDKAYEKLVEANYDFGPVIGNGSFVDIDTYDAKIVRLDEIFEGAENTKVIAIVDGNDNYITIGTTLMVIDSIGGADVNDIEFVGKNWLENTVVAANKWYNSSAGAKEASTGAFPPATDDEDADPFPDVAVNGVPVEPIEEECAKEASDKE